MTSSDGATTRLGRQSRETVAAVVLLLPAIALLVVFFAWPVLQAIWLGFTRWDGFGDPKWIGIDNYVRMLDDEAFQTAVFNNLKILLAVPIWVALPFLVASAIHDRVGGSRAFRLAFFFPAILSTVVVGVFWGILLRDDGPVNEALRAVGLGGLAQPWLAQTSTALPVVIAIIIWASFGIGVVIFLAALGTLDQDQLDAAQVDGAGWWRTQWHIIVPEVRPVIEFYTVIVVITVFTGIFPIIYTLTAGGPGYSTLVLEYDIYREAFANGSLGYASAIGVVLFLMVTLIASVGIRVMRQPAGRS